MQCPVSFFIALYNYLWYSEIKHIKGEKCMNKAIEIFSNHI